MNIVDIINKKRYNSELSKEDIEFFVNNYVNNKIPDYQISALLMAIVFNGMNERETYDLTMTMKNSGEVLDLSCINGHVVDKHSTGGVGDKTTLLLAPMVAACGVKVAKMSGRGLGHTGGTLDKLESIPNFSIKKTKEDFIEQVNKIGLSIIGQTDSLVPADKKLYALRDVTGTVRSLPLIASSVMSKKLASGCDSILLDVTWGSGAFMTDIDEAIKLSELMVKIGKMNNKDTQALITNMDEPLGYAIGNNLEVKEVIDALNGKGPQDLIELCLSLGSIMLMQAKKYDNIEDARAALKKTIKDKTALAKFRQMVIAQGGDIRYIDNPSFFPLSKTIYQIKSPETGYVSRVDALRLGIASMHLGAGRETLNDVIDYSSGIVLRKKVGDSVKKGDVICELHTNKDNIDNVIDIVMQGFEFSSIKIIPNKLIVRHIK